MNSNCEIGEVLESAELGILDIGADLIVFEPTKLNLHIKSLKIDLTFPAKSPLTPLFQRGEFPPVDKGRLGGIF
jgi:hypothetical protein